ncbi:MAG: hypothetical protein ACYS8W_18765 [Planctomycetota bacterium]
MLNAITIRNLQSKFRLQNPWVVFGAGIYVFICGLLFLIAYSFQGPFEELSLHPFDPAIRLYFGLQISLTYLVLFVYGTLSVSESVAGLKENNAFDFEQIAPRGAWSFAFGNLVGAPLYAYFLTALGLIFSAFAVFFSSGEAGGTSVMWTDFFCHIIILAGGAFLLHGFALFTSMIFERRLSAFLISLIAVAAYFGVGFLAFFPAFISKFSVISPTSFAIGFFPVEAADNITWKPALFGIKLISPFILPFIIQILLGFGFLTAAARKFDRPNNVPISKFEVLLVLAALSVLMSAVGWNHVTSNVPSGDKWWLMPEARVSFFSLVEIILLVNIGVWIIFCFVSAPTSMDYRRYYDPHRLSKRNWLSYFFGTGASIFPTGLLNGILLAAVLFLTFILPGGYTGSLGQMVAGKTIWSIILIAWGITVLIILFYSSLTGLLALSTERSGKIYALAIFCFFFILPFFIAYFTSAENREAFFVLNPFTAIIPLLPDGGVTVSGVTAACCGEKVGATVSLNSEFHLLTALVFYGISTIVLTILLFIRQKRLRRSYVEEAP